MSMKSELCSCIHCRKEYTAKGIFTHVDRTHLNLTHYSSGFNGKYKVLSKRAAEEKDKNVAEYMLSPKLCKECNLVIDYDSRGNDYCSHSCSATATNKLKPSRTIASRLKTSVKIKKPRHNCICNICGIEFESIDPGKDFCGKICRANKRKEELRSKRPALTNYRSDCAFKFNLRDYPTEFNFALIAQHGWYKAKNRGDNLTGISRDHMVSVRFGFDNNIDPKIISHPANCQLLVHGENISKNIKCSITLKELLERIKDWNNRYQNKQWGQ